MSKKNLHIHCSRCAHAGEPQPDNQGAIPCKRHPPVVHMVPKVNELTGKPEMGFISVFPHMSVATTEMWCGEFRSEVILDGRI